MVSYLLSSPMDINVDHAKDIYIANLLVDLLCSNHSKIKHYSIIKYVNNNSYLYHFLGSSVSSEMIIPLKTWYIYICFYSKFTFSVHKKIRRRFYIDATMFIQYSSLIENNTSYKEHFSKSNPFTLKCLLLYNQALGAHLVALSQTLTTTLL